MNKVTAQRSVGIFTSLVTNKKSPSAFLNSQSSALYNDFQFDLPSPQKPGTRSSQPTATDGLLLTVMDRRSSSSLKPQPLCQGYSTDSSGPGLGVFPAAPQSLAELCNKSPRAAVGWGPFRWAINKYRSLTPSAVLCPVLGSPVQER